MHEAYSGNQYALSEYAGYLRIWLRINDFSAGERFDMHIPRLCVHRMMLITGGYCIADICEEIIFSTSTFNYLKN